jgi:hypothetical protein
MTDTAVSISQSDIQVLEESYTLRGRTDILQFLDKYPFLLPVLLEAPEKIRQYFPDSQLFLEVVPDAEIIDWVHLVLSILINFNPYDAVQKLNQIDWDWGIHNSYEVRSKFFITLEYADEL